MSFAAVHDIAPPAARPASAANSIRAGPGQYHRATTAPVTANASGSTNTHKAAAANRQPVKISSPPTAAVGLSAEHCEHPAWQSDISGEFTESASNTIITRPQRLHYRCGHRTVGQNHNPRGGRCKAIFRRDKKLLRKVHRSNRITASAKARSAWVVILILFISDAMTVTCLPVRWTISASSVASPPRA